LEEMLEQFALKFLKQHTKPIVLVSVNGYYEKLFALFDQMIEERFIKADVYRLFDVVGSAGEVAKKLDSYTPPDLPNKWYSKDEV